MIYKINGVDLSAYSAFAVISGEQIAASGIFDCPKRKSPTERSWDTSVEPFVEAQDIVLEQKEIAITVVQKSTGNFNLLQNAIINASYISVDDYDISVINTDEIIVTEIGGLKKLQVKFKTIDTIIPTLTYIASNSGKFRIDGYNLHDQFGIHSNKDGGFYNIPKRLEVNTTEMYSNTIYRDFREISINCFLIGSSFADIMEKITQFQALLLKPGMRLLYVEGITYVCYFKDGFKAQMVAENLLKFTLKLHTND